MPNIIDADGLQTKDFEELTEELEEGYRAIYGDDINLDSDSPDGQTIGLFRQAALDNLDLLAQIYNSFDPDAAFGRTLDKRVALNGIQRLGGTFTITPISITIDRALSLEGLDDDVDDPDGEGYTVEDNAGNQFILVDSEAFGAAGTYSRNFRAKDPGAVETVPNTITVPVTVVLGVTTVNNPTTYTTLGIDEETDAQLKIRRQRSVALSSKGYLQGLVAALLNINEVTSAYVYENVTGSTDGDGVPGHSIWVIVDGGEDADVAEAIYQKRNAGCGMKGDEVYEITQVDDTIFQVQFDRVADENLYIEFDVEPIDGSSDIDADAMKEYIVDNLVPDVYETVNINQLSTIVQDFDDNALVTGAGFSKAALGPYTNTLTPTLKKNRFVLATTRIAITEI